MEIVQEFSSSSGPKKAYIVETSLGPRVVVEAGRDGETSEWPTLEDDGTITYANPDIVPKYVQKLAEKAFKALADLRDERHEAISFTEWLLQQEKRSGPVGDLAAEARKDENWPADGTTYQDFSDYLNITPAQHNTVVALSRAWSEYVREMGDED